MLHFSDVQIEGKRLLIRADLNCPLAEGEVASDKRIRAILPTLHHALQKNAEVIVCSHLGRPKEGVIDQQLSLAPIAKKLSELLGQEVPLIPNLTTPLDFSKHRVQLLENVRFNVGEGSNDVGLAKQYAALADIVVMDAFGSAHRRHASTEGVLHHAKLCCGGPLLWQEVEALNQALRTPKRPLIAIVGGAKVSTKLEVLTSLLRTSDQVIVGGGIANTFLAAKGLAIGQSLYEESLLDTARQLLQQYDLPLPEDVIVSTALQADANALPKTIEAVAADEMILDIGQKTTQHYGDLIAKAGTILWNGPVGVFEFAPFAAGTEHLAQAIADSPAFTIAGGGDTIAAIDKYNIANKISYISTGGGAFLEYIANGTLPVIDTLINIKARF